MKNLLIIIIILVYNNLFSAAPPVDDKPLPPPPYIMNNVNKLNILVEWDSAAVRQYLPKNFQDLSKLSGGISIFNSKKNNLYLLYPEHMHG